MPLPPSGPGMPTGWKCGSTPNSPSDLPGSASQTPGLFPNVLLHFLDFVRIFEEATTTIRGRYANGMAVQVHPKLTL
jgi:hypothetical protein